MNSRAVNTTRWWLTAAVALVVLSLGLLIAVSITAIGGSDHAVDTERPKAQAQIGPDVVFAYAQHSEIHLYQSGKDQVLGQNPAGYDSEDCWYGYSRQLGGIVFYRYRKTYLSLLRIDLKNRKMQAQRFSSSYYPDLNPYDLSLCGSMLCQVRGYSRRVELWVSPIDGRWRKKCGWILPNNVPVPSLWRVPVYMNGDSVVFQTPSDYVVVGSTADRHVKILSEGDAKWHDPQYNGSYANNNPVPLISPDRKYVVFRPDYDPNKGAFIGMVPLQGGHSKTLIVWKNEGAPILDYWRASMVPADVAGFHWVPGSNTVAIQVMPAECGQSYVFLTEVSKNVSSRLPFMVERDQWCIVSDSVIGPDSKIAP